MSFIWNSLMASWRALKGFLPLPPNKGLNHSPRLIPHPLSHRLTPAKKKKKGLKVIR